MSVATNDEILGKMIPIIATVTGESEDSVKSRLDINSTLTDFTDLDALSNEIIQRTVDAFRVPISASKKQGMNAVRALIDYIQWVQDNEKTMK